MITGNALVGRAIIWPGSSISEGLLDTTDFLLSPQNSLSSTNPVCAVLTHTLYPQLHVFFLPCTLLENFFL